MNVSDLEMPDMPDMPDWVTESAERPEASGGTAAVVPFRRPRRQVKPAPPAAGRGIPLSSVLWQAVRVAARPAKPSADELIREELLLEVLQVIRKARG